MNCNFEEEYNLFASDPQERFENPLDFINNGAIRSTEPRSSLEGIARHEEIPSFDPLNTNLGLKKIFSSNNPHDMFHEENEKLCEIAEHKYDLSEEHRVMDEIKDVVEMGSYLREHVTSTGFSGEAQSNSEFEQISQVELQNSNEESSSGDCTLSEMFEGTHESGNSSSISREGLRRMKRTSPCLSNKASSREHRALLLSAEKTD